MKKKRSLVKGKSAKKKKAGTGARVSSARSRGPSQALPNRASKLAAIGGGGNTSLPPLQPGHWAIINSAMEQLRAFGVVATTETRDNPDNPPLPPVHPGHLAILDGAIEQLRSLGTEDASGPSGSNSRLPPLEPNQKVRRRGRLA